MTDTLDNLCQPNPHIPRKNSDTPLHLSNIPYAVIKKLEQGERDLVRVSNTEPTEGTWYFTHVDNTWYHLEQDCHYNQETGRLEMRTKPGQFRTYGPVSFYHTHPLNGHNSKKLAEQYLEEEHPKIPKGAIPELVKPITLLHLCLPSTLDLVGTMDRQVERECIASPLGITTYNIQGNQDPTTALIVYENLLTEINYRLIHALAYDPNRKVRTKEVISRMALLSDSIIYFSFEMIASNLPPSMQMKFTPYQM